MTTTITVPDFRFAAFYYPELFEALIAHKRTNVPEHTDESMYDPLMQLISMMALVGHLNNCNADLVANESTLPTAKLRESVRAMLGLIGYKLAPASPSQADILMKLAQLFTLDTVVVPSLAQVSIQRQGDNPVIYFEALEALTVGRTDRWDRVLAKVGSAFTDYTSEANDRTLGDTFSPWSVLDPVLNDALYFGHPQAMTDTLSVVLATPASNITGGWEYYDGNFNKGNPDEIEDRGGYLRVKLNGYLGTSKRPGTKIRVVLNSTTALEELYSQWDGVNSENYVDTAGYLGQSSPSLTAADYTIGSDWEPLPDLTDGTVGMTQNGKVEFRLPQSLTEEWIEGEVNTLSQFWVRWRILEVIPGFVKPVFEYIRRDEGNQYCMAVFTQGVTQLDSPLGSSDGTANQRFTASLENYIADSGIVWVDDVLWAEVDNFLNSRSTDRHFRIELGENDRPTIIFGDGVTGRIPPLGVGNIVFRYRTDATVDGNVGAETISEDKSGLSTVSSLWNPRPATGWTEAEGTTETSLARAKLEGPASLRIRDVALNGSDVERMTTAFVSSSGGRPFARARCFEGSGGPKTIETIVVASGGGAALAEQIAELLLYFNGDKFASPPVEKRVVANQQVTVQNYTPKVINITGTVYASKVTVEEIENQLRAVFQPESLKDDGVTFEWDFGEDVPTSRIGHEIFSTSPWITKVELSLPAADVPVDDRELPVIGTVNLTMIEG